MNAAPQPAVTPRVEVRDLRRVFGKTVAVDGIGFALSAGHVFGFVGPNGAGKTTTMRIMATLDEPDAGDVLLDGVSVVDYPEEARRRIGYMPEHPQMYRFLTGMELLVMSGRLFGMRGRALAAKAEELIESVGLAGAADRRIAGYSRGMMQRIALAQALVNDPDLVILDEPTSGFDPIGRAGIRAIIAGLRSAGKTVFFSSHELSEVERICDRVGIIADGRLLVDGKTDQLAKTGESLEQYFLRILT